MNQTLDKRPSLGFASSQHVSLSKRRGRLGNLRESVFPLRVFHFALYLKPGVENLGVFSLRHIDQIPRFSNSEFSISHYTQTENSELKSSAKVYPSNDCLGDSLIFGTGVLMSIRPSFSKTPNNQLSSFDTKTMAY